MKFEPLLNTDEAATLLQVHPKTLERWAREARVSAYDLGRWKFRASELDTWLRRSVHSDAANSAA
jgi:excisionase family DNA binding protein